MGSNVLIEPQKVDAPLTNSATFLVLSLADTPEAVKSIRSTLASIDDLAKNVAIRDLSASFACTGMSKYPQAEKLHRRRY